jgi:transcriptional regulator with XRE-family HTH domain
MSAPIQGPPTRRPRARPESARFAQLLTAYREHRQLTLGQLARAAGCDLSYLVRIEHGDRDPPRRYLVNALADGLALRGFAYRQFVTAAGYAPVREWTPELEATYRAGPP